MCPSSVTHTARSSSGWLRGPRWPRQEGWQDPWALLRGEGQRDPQALVFLTSSIGISMAHQNVRTRTPNHSLIKANTGSSSEWSEVYARTLLTFSCRPFHTTPAQTSAVVFHRLRCPPLQHPLLSPWELTATYPNPMYAWKQLNSISTLASLSLSLILSARSNFFCG